MSKKISITGTADKRFVVYPLLYAANVLGSAAVLTDDSSFRRLINGKKCGEISNTYIDTAYQNQISLPANYSAYDYIIGVSCDETPVIDSEITIETVRDGEELNTDNSVRIGYAPAKKEKAIIINHTLCAALYKMETESRLFPLNSTQVNKTLSALFVSVFERNEKEIIRLLKYKGGKRT